MALITYRRRLPHILPPGETVFVTFRLAGSVPYEQLQRWRAAQQLHTGIEPSYGQLDHWLEQHRGGPDWLRWPAVAAAVQEALHYRHPAQYHLWAYCLMPNHVHLVLGILPTVPLVKVLQGLKRHTARQCNQIVNRQGAFWQDESYDRVLRNADQVQKTVAYVLNNPVKAGLCTDWTAWPYSYLSPDY